MAVCPNFLQMFDDMMLLKYTFCPALTVQYVLRFLVSVISLRPERRSC